jgi:cholesterol transport system auxiliary component
MKRGVAILTRRAGMLALAGAFSGCAALFTEPPKHLYRVTPDSSFPPGLPHISAQLLVDDPTAPSGLDTSRIALSRSPVTLDYFAGSEWTDRVPVLVQTALVESFQDSRAITAIGRETIGLRADFLLKSDIRHFEAVYAASGGPPTIWVAINLLLVEVPADKIIAQTTVSRRRTAAANTIPEIVLAFNDALGAALADAVVWTVTNPHLSMRRRS